MIYSFNAHNLYFGMLKPTCAWHIRNAAVSRLSFGGRKKLVSVIILATCWHTMLRCLVVESSILVAWGDSAGEPQMVEVGLAAELKEWEKGQRKVRGKAAAGGREDEKDFQRGRRSAYALDAAAPKKAPCM